MNLRAIAADMVLNYFAECLFDCVWYFIEHFPYYVAWELNMGFVPIIMESILFLFNLATS